MSRLDELRAKLCSVSAVTVMPFTPDDRPDLHRLRRHLERLAGSGVGTCTLHGSVGEFASLTGEERRAATRAALEVVPGAAAVIGVGGALAVARAEASDAVAAGAGMVMVHQPTHPLRSPDGWVEYHRLIAAEIPEAGLVVYLRDPAITPAHVAELAARAPNLVGIKFALPDVAALTRLASCLPPAIGLLCGLAEPWARAFWAAGARGFTSGVANVEPGLARALLNALRRGDDARAAVLAEAVQPFEDLRARGGGATSVGVVKEAMRQRGIIDVTAVRPPLSPLPDGDRSRVGDVLEALAATR